MSSLVVAYEQLLLDNVGTVRTVESAIRNVTWFLPGRFNDADIASEGRACARSPFDLYLAGQGFSADLPSLLSPLRRLVLPR